MKKFMYKCQSCSTIMTIETDLNEKYVHMAPPCICGKSRMINMATDEYAYGILNRKNNWE